MALVDDDDQAAAEVAAAQFAGGMSVAQVAELWERDAEWVENAIRLVALRAVPRRDGGLKTPRAEARAGRNEEAQTVREMQTELEW